MKATVIGESYHYREMRDRLVNHLRGMFAFTIRDGKKQRRLLPKN